MIYDSKLSNTIAKEKQRLTNELSRWNLKVRKKKKSKRTNELEDLRPMMCVHCQHLGEQERCIRCPLYKSADGSTVRVK